jgi:hypothetical protein
MHASFNRRSATKVKGGRVQKKNRARRTCHEGYILDRESPGRGFRHLVSKRDVQAFIDIFPEWDRFSERLERIVLARHCEDDGSYVFYHREESGIIFLHAWPEELWIEVATSYYEAHQGIFDRLGVSCELVKEGVTCRFTEAQARAYILLHVFVHELGHHFDRINQKHAGVTKGEDHAENFATVRFDQLFPAYVQVFGDPRKAA